MLESDGQVLLISADHEWRSSLSAHLSMHGLGPVMQAHSAAEALVVFQKSRPRLVLVDTRLRDSDAMDLCTRLLLLKPGLAVAVVAESEEAPAFAALQAGISGCLIRSMPLQVWPGLVWFLLEGGAAFSRHAMNQLVENALALHRPATVRVLGHLCIDASRHQVTYAGQRIHLTPREFTLLICLAEHCDTVVTNQQLLREAWGYERDVGAAAEVRLYIARLRRKLNGAGAIADAIETERGIGYRLHSTLLALRPVSPAVRTLGEKSTRRLPDLAAFIITLGTHADASLAPGTLSTEHRFGDLRLHLDVLLASVANSTEACRAMVQAVLAHDLSAELCGGVLRAAASIL